MLAIRFARMDERAALVELQRRASLAVADYRDDLLAHPDAIDLPLEQIDKRQVRVATLNETPIGFSAIIPSAGGICELDGLFVEPVHWRRGVGRLLVHDALDCATADGQTAMEVIANPKAEEFYRKLGFLAVGVAETRFGPAIRMRREVGTTSNMSL